MGEGRLGVGLRLGFDFAISYVGAFVALGYFYTRIFGKLGFGEEGRELQGTKRKGWEGRGKRFGKRELTDFFNRS
jgi:hypothetical protein